MNEEEVKIKIILPYLQRLGLQACDLRFEKSFSLQIGTNRVLVNGHNPKRNAISGRLDTLITRGGRNLLILELKESTHALTDEDRDQAVSYARLVHPIAPYAVLTNGNEWQIFNTITKDRLRLGDFKIKDGYQLTLPDTDRNAALSFFLGYSVENLLQFCQSQVNEQLKPLVGSPKDLTKKYIPELTTPRTALLEELTSFENAPANGFLLLAESGYGKTSALCDYARGRLAQLKPTLFFSGATLENGLLSAITSEFGWTFPEQLTPVVLIRRLSELAKHAPVIVVIDAIDEWTYAQRAQSILSLLRGSRDLRVKFVFSCRTAAWEDISQPNGSDIGFAEYLFSPSRNGEPKGAYHLASLTSPEFYRAVENYRKVFKVDGAFEDKALNEARMNPFMLRVMFAVAAELGRKHLTFSSREFFEKYLDLLLRKCGRRDVAQAQILGIARLMFDRNEEAVSDTEIRRSLALSANEALMPALFEQNILQRRGDSYAFYFQHLRNYLIAFKVCGWASATPTVLATVERSGVRGDALAFYLRYATPEQIQAVTDPIWKNAHEYLKLYTTLVTRHFAQLDRELAPGSGPELGFIAEYVVRRHTLGVYGFRRREAGEDPVLLLPVDNHFSNSNLPHITGAHSMHNFGTSNGFLNVNIRNEVIEHEIIEGVKNAIERRLLSLRGCGTLANEALVSEIWNDRETFESFFDPQKKTLQFPFSVKVAQKAIQRAKLRCHFEHELIENKRHKGEIKETWSGDSLSYSPQISREEKREIDTAVEKAIVSGNIPALRVVSKNLRDLEKRLNRTGVFDDVMSIERAPWVSEYALTTETGRGAASGIDLLRDHIRILYQELLRVYQVVVDTNFPTLKDAFPLRAQMPLRLFLDVEISSFGRNQEIQGRLITACERLATSSDNEVVMCSPGELEIGGRQGALYRGQPITQAYNVSLRLERNLYSMGDLLLTNMVYARIAQEWPTVADALRRAEGISAKSARGPLLETVVIN